MATTVTTERLDIRTSEDVVRCRQRVRALAIEAGLGLVDQTKIVTAASELARNTLDYGGGYAEMGVIAVPRPGVRLSFVDQGPGIPDIELALRDGYSTGGGLGLGLSGARRLATDFSIDSAPGKGTRVTISRCR